MSFVLQVIVVAAIVIACTAYSTWRLLSGAARQRVLKVLAAVPGVASSAWFAALHARTQVSLGCGSCGVASAASPKQTPGALRR
jgi:hypothetical protein